MNNADLVAQGYRVVSRAFRMVARIDRADWRKRVLRYLDDRGDERALEDWYRRVLSSDRINVDSIGGIPNSSDSITGYCEKAA